MHEHEAVRNKLWDVYRGLSSLEQSLIHLCAVIHEPATAPVVFNCYRNTRMAARYPHITSLKAITPILQNLQKWNLLTDRLQCHSVFMEIAIRLAAECQDPTYFQDLVDTVQDTMPISDYLRCPAGSKQHGWRLMRDFRIGIYTLNLPQIRECYQQLVSQFGPDAGFVDPYVCVFQNPFDRNWLKRLPMDVQTCALTAIFSHTLSQLVSDADALAYSVSPEFLERMPECDKPEFYAHLIPRLLLGGQIATSRTLLSEMADSALLTGFSGWASLVEGRTQTAVELFETDLDHLRKWTKNKTGYFKGLVGIFYMLALLKQSDSSLFEKLNSALNSAQSNRFHGDVLDTHFTLLKAIGHIQKFETEAAADILDEIQTGADPLTDIFFRPCRIRYFPNPETNFP